VSDPRFTLPESPELLARAEAVARQRYDDWSSIEADPQRWADLWISEREQYIGAALLELRDLTRPASYDAAIRWLAELIVPGSPADSWTLFRLRVGWALCREYDGESVITVAVTDNDTADRREALVLALTAALEARR
jgi:hypothetical protein